jgi:curved DNA-binding protein
MRIRLSGQGNLGPGGAGDLYLKMRLLPDQRYKLEGSDIVVDIPLTPWDAALGVTSEIDTPGGKLSLKIPAGVSSGQRLRLKGKGLAHRGDLFAQIRIVIPKRLSSEEKNLFSELRKVSSFKAQ